DIVLLNNDAVVTRSWLEAMQEPLSLSTDIGLVVPRQTLLPRTSTSQLHAPYANSLREIDVNLSQHHGNVTDPNFYPVRGVVELSLAPCFCVYMTRECLGLAGLLDAESGRHYRSDRLYCDVVRNSARMRIVYTPHAKLYHFLQQSTKELHRT